MKELLSHLSRTRVLVVGDLMVDTYLWGEVERVSPEAPVPVVRVNKEEAFLGGAGNVVANLASLGCGVAACGIVGDDAAGARLRELLRARGAAAEGVVTDPSRPTIEKTRIVAQHQQMLRFDREEPAPAPPAVAAQVAAWLARHGGEFDGIIVSDYGKGLVTAELMAALCALPGGGARVMVDPKGRDFSKYRGAGCLTPNEREAAVAAGIAATDDDAVAEAGARLMADLALPALCITRGSKGVLAMAGGERRMLAANAREVYDVTGAGDTFISVLAALSFAGQDFFVCAEAANVAAGVVVGKLGTATVAPDEMLAAVEGAPRRYGIAEITAIAARLRTEARRVVFTNGCFDLLHAGHIQYLQASRDAGDVLIVGLNSDDSVRRLKGPGRPVIGEDDRAHLLGALACVDYVVVFAEDDSLELIRAIRPHVLTKGADYTVETVVGHELVAEWGGEVRLVPLAENRSTSGLIEKIAGRGRG